MANQVSRNAFIVTAAVETCIGFISTHFENSCNQDNEQCVSAVSPSPAIVQLTKKVQESEAMVLQLTRQVQMLQNELSKSAPRNLGRRQQRVGEPQK